MSEVLTIRILDVNHGIGIVDRARWECDETGCTQDPDKFCECCYNLGCEKPRYPMPAIKYRVVFKRTAVSLRYSWMTRFGMGDFLQYVWFKGGTKAY